MTTLPAVSLSPIAGQPLNTLNNRSLSSKTQNDYTLQEEQEEERSRERRSWSDWKAQEAPWRSRKCRRHAPPQDPLRQIPSWLLR